MTDLPDFKLDRRRFLQGVAGTAVATTVATALSPALAEPDSPAIVAQMRSQAQMQERTDRSTSAAPASLAVIALNRMGFGPRPGDIAAFNALGANDDARLAAYVEQQLDPAAITDTELDTRLAEAAFTTLDKTLEELWMDHVVNAPDYTTRTMPIRDTERATFIKAMYSKKQLFEVLADFWHNHFSTYGWHYNVAPVFVHYDRDIIRGNLLGNFRTMLEAVGKSPAMLYYLDNFTNSREGPNENYARELFELHTLGAENYLGVMRQADVPVDGQGFPLGYVDDDVYEATRCFTGWTVADSDSGPGGNTGLFLYRDDWHDRFQKNVLKHYFPPDQAQQQDGQDVYDLLASHPGTARYICRKLCRRLINDTPSNAIVQSAADLFIAQKDAPDQLKQVVRHILLSNEFKSTWGGKIKRPFEVIASSLRATNADFTIKHNDGDSDSFLYYYSLIGQQLFNWRAPNGYPDYQEDWQGTTSLVMRWRMINWLVEVTDDASVYRLNVLAQTPANVRSPNALTDFWLDRILGRAIDSADRTEIVEFIAQGRNPDYDMPLDTDTTIQDRLRAMVALIMMSPEFQWR